MAHATFPTRFSAVAAVVVSLLGGGAMRAGAQDLSRVNQDELASFYGRMNVVVGSGARAFGMGGAFLARADDGTAASWNPAGLSYLRRTEISMVGAHSDFSQRIPREDPSARPPVPITSTDRLQASVVDFIGAAYPIRIREHAGAIQLSYERSFSFSGARRSEGTIRQKGFAAPEETVLSTEFLVSGSGGFDTLSLSTGMEVHRRLRLGLAINQWVNGFSQEVSRPDRRVQSDWRISGTNFNFGLLFTPEPRLNLGAVVKTPFNADVFLTKDRRDIGTRDAVTGELRADTYNRHQSDVRITFPRVYGVGASFRPTNTITVSADFTRTEWSQAKITGFFSLPERNVNPRVDFYGTLPFPGVEFGPDGQADTNQIRVGAEWVLRLGQAGNTLIPLRAGFFRDGQPVIIRLNDATGPLPEVNPIFSGFTAGLGLTVGGALFDVAYIREAGTVPASRTSDGIANAETSIRYNRLFASVMVRLGSRR